MRILVVLLFRDSMQKLLSLHQSPAIVAKECHHHYKKCCSNHFKPFHNFNFFVLIISLDIPLPLLLPCY